MSITFAYDICIGCFIPAYISSFKKSAQKIPLSSPKRSVSDTDKVLREIRTGYFFIRQQFGGINEDLNSIKEKLDQMSSLNVSMATVNFRSNAWTVPPAATVEQLEIILQQNLVTILMYCRRVHCTLSTVLDHIEPKIFLLVLQNC